MDKNLIVKISNGFGNQMFLYAAAYAFSKKLGYNLLIDDETGVIYDFRKWVKRKRINWRPNYELSIFNLKSGIASKKFKFLTSQSQIKRKYLKFADTFLPKKNFIFEKLNKDKKTFFSDHYYRERYKNTIFLEGYFESEKYFQDYRKDLLNEFSLKSEPNLNNNIYKKIIDTSNVVSIAFRTRRFTETDRDHSNKNMQLKTSDFENDAVQYIYRGIDFFKSKIDKPKFLIWSDNFDYLDKYFDPNLFTFVKNDSDNKILLDFFLMRQCKYFIVGPTSFHWWAAWLCDHDNKIIVCPENKDLNLSCNDDFWPVSWIKV